jgi:hypothetical protein
MILIKAFLRKLLKNVLQDYSLIYVFQGYTNQLEPGFYFGHVRGVLV